jgi:arylsulfatase
LPCDYGLQGKGFHYDCILRTPLIVAGPGLPQSQRIDAVTSTLDLVPTLLDLAGVAEPEAVQGISMKPTLLTGEPPVRCAALTENDDDMGRVRFRTLRTDRWKLTHYLNQDFGELYDLRADPQEARNLWADPSLEPIRTELTAMLLDEVLCGIDLRNGRAQKPRPLVAKWHTTHPRE